MFVLDVSLTVAVRQQLSPKYSFDLPEIFRPAFVLHSILLGLACYFNTTHLSHHFHLSLLTCKDKI